MAACAEDLRDGICESTQLVEKIAEGSWAAEEQLVLRYRKGVIRLLTRLTNDPARAEDLTHETFIVVLVTLRADRIREPDKLTSFINQTARFIYLGWLRRSDNQVELRDSLDDVASIAEIEHDVIVEQKHETLRRSIAELSIERDRDILFRRYICGQSKSEICDSMVLPQINFDRIISRARGRLRDKLAPA